MSTDATYDGVWSVTVATTKLIGIVTVLQKLLLKESLSVDEQTVLLTLLEIAPDTLDASDTISTVTTTSKPYFVGTTAITGFSTLGT